MSLIFSANYNRAADTGGNPLKGIRRYVFLKNRDVLAPLFEDENLTVAAANPSESGADGTFPFRHTFRGEYRIEIRSISGELILVDDEVVVGSNNDSFGFDTLDALKTDIRMSDASFREKFALLPGAVLSVKEGNFQYRIAPDTATDHEVELPSGVKLYAMAGPDGFVRPEQFGAVGDGITDDTVAMRAMTDFGRRTGSLNWRGTSGQIYTTTNAFIFASIPYQKHRFEGAAIRNIRGSSATDVGLTTNYEGLNFPPCFNTNGPDELQGGYYFGERIASASIGDDTLTVLDNMTGVGFEPGADVLIYGFMKTGFGFPPDPQVFEYARIGEVSGNQITLLHGLQNDYDSRWPDRQDTNIWGAARVISLNRPNFTAIQNLDIADMYLKSNPNWTTSAATQSDGERNGRLTLAGYMNANVRNLRCDGGFYLQQGQSFHGKRINIRRYCEPDKIIDRAIIEDFKGARLQGGTVLKYLELINPEAGELFNVAPMGTLKITGGKIEGSHFSSGILNTPEVVRNYIIDGTEFVTGKSGQRGIINPWQYSADFAVISQTRLEISRDDFFGSNISRFFSPDLVLCKGGVGVFQITSMPYQEGTNIVLEGQSLQALSGIETLEVYTLNNLSIKNVTVSGPYADQIRAVHNPFYQSQVERFVADTPWDGENHVAMTSREMLEQEGNAFRHVGRPLSVERAVVVVDRPYTGSSGTAQLRVRNYEGAATYCLVDLKQAGQRVIDIAGTSGLKAGESGSVDIDPLRVLRIDRTANLAGDNVEQPRWRIRLMGTRLD